MIGKIAWKNVWRTPSRSLVLIAAITIGIWSLIFLLAFVRGQVENYVSNTINSYTGHINIQKDSFFRERLVKYFMPNGQVVANKLRREQLVRGVSGRIKLNGMIASGNSVQGGIVYGLQPAGDTTVFSLHKDLVEGTFFQSDFKNPILVSEGLAKKLKVRLKSKVIFTFQTAGEEMASAAFRIAGIYNTGNSTIDNTTAYALQIDLQSLAGIPGGAFHEIIVNMNDIKSVEAYANKLQKQFPGYKVRTYREVAPELSLFESQIRINMVVMSVIFMLALIFGIINTMLMAVLERMKEIGMLMAIGMNKWRVFLMVVLETIMISCISIPIGIFLGYFTVVWLNNRGIDLSAWSEGLAQFGISDLIRPEITFSLMLFVACAVVLTAIIGSIYPAWKAIQLRPVEALRRL